MGRPERVVDVQLGVVGQRLGERGVVPLLLDVEAQVLEEQRLARPQPLDGVLGAEPERVAGARDVEPEQLAQALGDRPEPEAVLDLAVGSPEMAGQDDPGALAEQGADRRDRRPGSASRRSPCRPASGTLKSTRTKTRLPDGSTSRMVSLSMVGWAASAQATATGIRSAT